MKSEYKNTASVQLLTNDESKVLVLSEFGGNQTVPYQCEVHISSMGFGFKGVFYFDNYLEFCASIEQMAAKLNGSAELKENYKDQAIKFEITNLGHVQVSGYLEHHSEHSQSLSFGFKTDQTCLAPFCKDLRKVLE